MDYGMDKFFRTQGQVTLRLIVESDHISKLSKILGLSYLFESFINKLPDTRINNSFFDLKGKQHNPNLNLSQIWSLMMIQWKLIQWKLNMLGWRQ